MKIPKLKVDYETPIEKQLKELRIKNWIDLNDISHTRTSTKNGYIYDVEDGTEMLNVRPPDAAKKFASRGRLGMNIFEGLALIRHNPKILKDHYLDILDSRYVSSYWLFFYLDGEKLALDYRDEGAVPEWGAPSFRESAVLESGNLGSLESRVLELEKFKKKVEQIINL